MKVRFFLLFFFLLGITFVSFGQKKFHVITLEKEVDPVSTNIKCVEVIDRRLIKTNIGFAQKGLSNRKVLAQLEGPFEETVKRTVNRIMASEENAQEVVFVIHEFNVSERTSAMKERGICRIEIEFAVKKDSSYFSLGSHFFGREQGGADVTKKHPDRILTCLSKCIEKFMESGWDGSLGEEIDLSELSANAYDFTQIPEKGLYASFNTLGRNKPMPDFENEFFRQDEKTKIERYIFKPVDKADKLKRVMFISDGENLYMHASRYCYQKYFIKAQHYGRYIYFEDKFSDANAGVAFGLIGYAATNKSRGIILDTTNGKVSLLDDSLIFNCSKDFPDILAVYKDSKRKLADRKKAIIQINEKYKVH